MPQKLKVIMYEKLAEQEKEHDLEKTGAELIFFNVKECIAKQMKTGEFGFL